MIRVDIPVVVEGKYDKITLENIISANIITTEGFGIFKDKQKADFLRRLAHTDGIVVVTDPDSAGSLIRSHIKSICNGGKIINVYIPRIKGREGRKNKSSAQGFLGVEGMTAQQLEEAFLKSGVGTPTDTLDKSKKITKSDLFSAGLSGSENSAAKRKSFSAYAGVPEDISANAFLDALNILFKRDNFFKTVRSWQQETGKS